MAAIVATLLTVVSVVSGDCEGWAREVTAIIPSSTFAVSVGLGVRNRRAFVAIDAFVPRTVLAPA